MTQLVDDAVNGLNGLVNVVLRAAAPQAESQGGFGLLAASA
jgi:hypothetical protein